MIVKTNHIQSGIAYCFWQNKIVEVPGPHVDEVCWDGCPYLNGSNQGEGIECLWNDGTNTPYSDAPPDRLEELGQIAPR